MYTIINVTYDLAYVTGISVGSAYLLHVALHML